MNHEINLEINSLKAKYKRTNNIIFLNTIKVYEKLLTNR